MTIKKLLIATLLLASWATISATTPMWLRYATISPNGDAILFTYKGMIYKVPAQGGEAKALTSAQSYSKDMVWSPDGKRIAFANDREGTFDLYVMNADGSNVQRITKLTKQEYPTVWTPDGKKILFTAAIQDPAKSVLFPRSIYGEVYEIPAEGGAMRQILGTPAEKLNWDKQGKFFLYQDLKGLEDKFRKHHTSSVTRDIWKYDVKTGKHTNLTQRAGEDRNPILAPDGKTIYFLSERNKGSFNVYAMDMNAPAQAKAITSFNTHPVRFLSMSNQGTLCYTYDGEIYTQASAKATPKKVTISISDNTEELPEAIGIDGRPDDAVISPNGKELAFVSRGEVFVTSIDYTTTKRITNTAAAEANVTWGADGRTLVYSSERDGLWQLYKATIAHKDDQNFANATVIKEEPLLADKKVEKTCPQFSPDGKELAFIEDRIKLKVLNIASKKVREVTDGSVWFNTGGGFDYQWSPNGKWFALDVVSNGHDPYSDVAIVSAQGGKVTNVSSTGYFSEHPVWTADGTAILFGTDRYGMRSHASWGSQSDLMIAFVNQDAYDKFRLSKEDYELRKELEKQQKKDKEAAEKKEKEKNDKDKKDSSKKDADKKASSKKADSTKVKEADELKIDLEGFEDRIVRITPRSGNVVDYTGAADDKFYYLLRGEGGTDIYCFNLISKDNKKVGSISSGSNISHDKDYKTFALASSGGATKMTSGGTTSPIRYGYTYYLDHKAEREYMFNHVCLQEQKRFYNKNMHGVNWELMTNAYRKFLPHIGNNRDFAELLSELLGELNVSHTGGRYYADGPEITTANMGLMFDWNYTGKGMKVDEIIEKGPFDHKNTCLKPGCIITKINDQDINTNTEFFNMMDGLAGKKTCVTIKNPTTNKEWNEVVLPISDGKLNTLLYNRWVKNCAKMVDSLSGGRLGYVHIESMNDASFRTIYSDILGKYNQKEGIVIDTRNNGGGRLHEDIEVMFSGEKYLTQVVRGREACDMPSRRWNKPSIMLQCEANYSNAHGTPWVYKYKNIGKLVGMPVPGTMTSVSWETLQDPTLVFGIPIIGYRTAEGNYLENSQLEPDFKVANNPETVVKGKDEQLEVAVKELLKEINAKK